FDALNAGKHCLVEKPVCHDYEDVWRAHALATSKNLKTKVGLTFRYAPAMQYMYTLVQEGFVGQPYIFNGWEQNSQWIDPAAPSRFTRTDTGNAPIKVGSLEGYGAPTIDISIWMVRATVCMVSSRPVTQMESRGAPSSTRTWCTTSPKRSATPAKQIRATSRRARACRRSSTRASAPTGSGAGSTCRWTRGSGTDRADP